MIRAEDVPPMAMTVPQGYTEVLTDDAADVLNVNGAVSHSVFRLMAGIEFRDMVAPLFLEPEAGWYFSRATLNNPVSLTFRENNVSSDSLNKGAALRCKGHSRLNIENCGNVVFADNSVSSTNPHVSACGGAIYANWHSIVRICDNTDVSFVNNSACGTEGSSVYGSADGGAVYGLGTQLYINNNASVIFSSNTTFSGGWNGAGALNLSQSDLSIQNNDSVIFEKNLVTDRDGIRLHGLSVVAGSNVSEVKLSAPEGKKIEFRDSFEVGYQVAISLNSDYENAEGESVRQTGTICFTGAYTSEHLAEMKGSAGTEEEIRNSRTGIWDSPATLYGGTLQVQDGFVLQGRGLTVAEESEATLSLRDAELDFGESDILLHAGTTLDLSGCNLLTGNLNLKDGSTVNIHLQDSHALLPVLTLEKGRIISDSSISFSFSRENPESDIHSFLLIHGADSAAANWTPILRNLPSDWSPDKLEFKWIDNNLWLRYDYSSLSWNAASSGGDWNLSDSGWVNASGEGAVFRNHQADVFFEDSGAGEMNLTETLYPGSVTVNNSEGKDYTFAGSGSLSGWMHLTKKGGGTLTINTANTYRGGTTISGGTVVLGANGALGAGEVSLSNATLNMGGRIISNNLSLSGTASILNGTNYCGNFTLNGNLSADSRLNLHAGKTATLRSGRVGGTLSGAGKVVKSGTGTVTLSKTNTYSGGTSITGGALVLGANNALGTGAVTLSNATLNMGGKVVPNNLTLNGSSRILSGTNYRGNFTMNGNLLTGSAISIISGKTANLKKGNVGGTISGAGNTVINGAVTLNGGKITTNKLTISGSGKSLSVNAVGLVMNKNASDIVLSAGGYMSSAGAITARNISLNNARLGAGHITLGGNISLNNAYLDAGHITLGGKLQATDSTVSFGNLSAGNLVLTRSSGSSARNLSLSGSVSLNSSSLHHAGNISAGNVTATASSIRAESGMKLSGTLSLSKQSSLTLSGVLSAANVMLSGNSSLNNAHSTVCNAVVKGKFQAVDSTVNMNGSLTAGNLVLSRSSLDNSGGGTLNLNLSGALTLSASSLSQVGNISAGNFSAAESFIWGVRGMKLSGNLSMGSKSTLNLSGALNAANVTLNGNSKLNLSGALNAANVTLNGNSVLNIADYTARRNAVVKGKLQATNSTVRLHGNLTAGNLVLNNTFQYVGGFVSITNAASLSNNAKLNINGYLRGKNLTLNKSSLRQHSNNSGVALTGTLTMNSGSSLTVQGPLSAANMRLSGGTINLTSTSFSSIKVSGTLTLGSSIDLNLGCKLTTGKNYTLIRFNKTNLSSRNNLAKLLGLTGSGATLTLRSTGIILKVTNAAAWNEYLNANKTAFNKAAEETEAVEIAESTVSEPSYDRSSADMFVQSNWGVVNASRAFTDTMLNGTSNRTVFGADKSSAVWLSAMGASSRLCSDGAAAGSDYNLYGAAVGMEQQLTEKSSLGLALGESYGKVNSFTSARTKQDTLHTALYGQYRAVERSRDAVLLDWSAAYGRTESKWQGTEWEQKSVQLDARATWAHQLTADTTVSGFAGMQYFASESADIALGIKSGSVQNLRGEFGVGVGHKLTGKTRLFSELSFVGDMVRHNPTAQTEGQRERGANPGRAGINFSVGGTHALNERWSVNASYNLELMERATSHSANLGGKLRF